MPLLDHFHPPLLGERHWESFHTAWIGSISDSLNRILPKEYFAEEQVHAGSSVEIDVATFESVFREREELHRNGTGNGVALATAPAVYVAPAATASVPAVFADDFEIRVIRNSGGTHVVAALEMVSPGNKDREDSRRAFAAKCASYLYQSIAVVIVDIVTNRSADLHRETLALLGATDTAPIPNGAALYAAAYRPIRRKSRSEVDVWIEPLAIGAVLPTLPLWLNAAEYVPIELEATYTDACKRRRIAGK